MKDVGVSFHRTQGKQVAQSKPMTCARRGTLSLPNELTWPALAKRRPKQKAESRHSRNTSQFSFSVSLLHARLSKRTGEIKEHRDAGWGACDALRVTASNEPTPGLLSAPSAAQ